MRPRCSAAGTNRCDGALWQVQHQGAGLPAFCQFESLNASGQPFGDLSALVLDGVTTNTAHFNFKSRRNAASVHLNPIPDAQGHERGRFLLRDDGRGGTRRRLTTWPADGIAAISACRSTVPTERRIIFSVWDSGGEAVSRSKVADTNRVMLMGKGAGVNSGRLRQRRHRRP